MKGSCFHTIVPEARIVLIAQKRFMTGLEKLQVQGFPAGVARAFAAKNGGPAACDQHFADLAGNAFSAPVIVSVLLAILSHLTELHLSMFGQSLSAPAASVDEDLEDVMDLFR